MARRRVLIQPFTPEALKHRDDLSRAYTPGVARVCTAIAEKPEDARRLTIKRNTVAVVTDGSAVLGLGNIGPGAALPVMEGKSCLFTEFAATLAAADPLLACALVGMGITSLSMVRSMPSAGISSTAVPYSSA